MSKAVISGIIFFLTAQQVFAQITVNLDILSEEVSAVEKTASESQSSGETITLSPPPEITLMPPKVEEAKPTKAAAPKKATVPVVKKAAAPKPPVRAQKEKLEIKESSVKDAHDRLKPRANPVPEVKVLAIANGDAKKQEGPKLSKHFLEQQETLKAAQETETKEPSKKTSVKTVQKASAQPSVAKPVEAPAPSIKTASSPEPKLSKRFLEQERLKVEEEEEEEKQETAKEQKTKSTAVAKQTDKKTASPPKMLLSSKKHEKTKTETTEAKEEEYKIPAIKWSVFHVPGKLTPAERSATLAKEIPEESATKQALQKSRRLAHIFLFENKSAELTEEMESALNTMIKSLKRSPSQRVLLYAYSAPTTPEFGRERQISLRRALKVRSYFSRNGISSLRVEIRPQGQKGAGTQIPNRLDILIAE